MVAALPVLLAHPALDWTGLTSDAGDAVVGANFLHANGERSLWLLALARWACIPFSLLGEVVCFRWAKELYGDGAGLLAVVLWCFSPNILAHGHLITTDVGATACGVLSFYVFRQWLKQPRWETAFAAGLALGLAQLAKATWIILFMLWPAIWRLWRCTERQRQAWRREGLQLLFTLMLAVYSINLGYGFEGSFRSLGSFQFMPCSQSASAISS